MVHELLGIQNGRVDLGLVPDIRPELKVSYYHVLTCPSAHHSSGNYLDVIYRPVFPPTASSNFW